MEQMDISRIILKAANAVVTLIVTAFLCLAGLYSGYALWDNARVYAEAENVQSDMISLMPVAQEEAQPPSFDELLAINPDVRGWLAIGDTKISYPVLQGETNLTYINTDIYGNFALAGSIYLDSRNEGEFGDFYSLLYGHHMDKGKMFGDLDLFKEEKFFREEHKSVLLTPTATYDIVVYACLIIPAADKVIFDPSHSAKDRDFLFDYARENALFINEAAEELLTDTEGARFLALSTCSSEFTDARTVLLTVLIPNIADTGAESAEESVQ